VIRSAHMSKSCTVSGYTTAHINTVNRELFVCLAKQSQGAER